MITVDLKEEAEFRSKRRVGIDATKDIVRGDIRNEGASAEEILGELVEPVAVGIAEVIGPRDPVVDGLTPGARLRRMPVMQETNISRRRFLGTSAAVAGPLILPSGSLFGRKVSPNQKLNIGVIGAGRSEEHTSERQSQA